MSETGSSKEERGMSRQTPHHGTLSLSMTEIPGPSMGSTSTIDVDSTGK